MNRRDFATRLSLFSASLLPEKWRRKDDTSLNPQSDKHLYGEGANKGQPGVMGVNYHGGDGVVGQTDSGRGVWGESNSGAGVYGRSSAPPGLLSQALSNNKNTGVFGESKNVGVWGLCTTSAAPAANLTFVGTAGVRGDGDAAGVAGFSKSGVGVYGDGTSVGVQGSSKTGLAGWFQGKVKIDGSLTKAGGAFKIDHPLAPDKKYLSHSFVESPDMMNVYNGNVITDTNGDATVALPSYFAVLNRDYRYQLTVIGQFAQAIVAGKLQGNRFKIKTDKPNVEVSWQVTGIRQDAWANAHRIQVEEDKPAPELGSYLHPELFGHAADKQTGL